MQIYVINITCFPKRFTQCRCVRALVCVCVCECVCVGVLFACIYVCRREHHTLTITIVTNSQRILSAWLRPQVNC